MAAIAIPCILSADPVGDLNPAGEAMRTRGTDIGSTRYNAEFVHVRFSDILGSLSSPSTASATWGEGVRVLSLADAVVGDLEVLPLDLSLEIPSGHPAAASWVLPPREVDTLTSPDHKAPTHVRHTAWGPNRLFRW
jgi:hypothetical protein